MAEVLTKDETKQAQPPVGSINRRVLNLAWPVVLEQVLETALGLADTALVGHYSNAAAAGVGTAVQIFSFLIVGLSALSTGVTILVAQAIGAGDQARANRLTKQAITWGIIISIPFAIAGAFGADWLIGLLGISDPEVARIGADYLRVVMSLVVFLTLLFVVGSALRGAGDSRTPMYVTLVANVINIGAAWLLIYGNLGFPALGPVGSAWAATIGRGIALAIMIAILVLGGRLIHINTAGGWRPDFGALRDLMRLGLPNAGQQMLTQLAFIGLIIIVVPLGTSALAAHNIIFNSFQLSFLPGFGFSIAATALVGQAVGAGNEREARQFGNVATLWGIAWMGLAGLLYFVFAPQVIALFLADSPQAAAAVEAGTLPLRLLAVVQPFWAILFIQSGALEGAGIVLFPAITTVVGVYGAVLVSWLAVSQFGWGLTGVWGAFLLTAPLGLLIGWRFQTARLVRPGSQTAGTLAGG